MPVKTCGQTGAPAQALSEYQLHEDFILSIYLIITCWLCSIISHVLTVILKLFDYRKISQLVQDPA